MTDGFNVSEIRGKVLNQRKLKRKGVYRSLDCRALNRIWIAVVAQAVGLHLRWGNGGAACRKSGPSYVCARNPTEHAQTLCCSLNVQLLVVTHLIISIHIFNKNSAVLGLACIESSQYESTC